MDIKDLAPGLQDKVAGKTLQEALEVIKAEGVELTDEQIDAVSGGNIWDEAVPYRFTHNLNEDGTSGCGGTFTTSSEFPQYCLLCGGKMKW